MVQCAVVKGGPENKHKTYILELKYLKKRTLTLFCLTLQTSNFWYKPIFIPPFKWDYLKCMLPYRYKTGTTITKTVQMLRGQTLQEHNFDL